jgi:hypothetical protein
LETSNDSEETQVKLISEMLGIDDYLYEDYPNQSDKNEQKFSNKLNHYYINDKYLKRSNSDSKVYVDADGYLLTKKKIDFNNNQKLKRSHSYLEVVEYKIGNT